MLNSNLKILSWTINKLGLHSLQATFLRPAQDRHRVYVGAARIVIRYVVAFLTRTTINARRFELRPPASA